MICRTCLRFHVTSLLRMVLVWSTGRKNRVHPLCRMHLHTKNERLSRFGTAIVMSLLRRCYVAVRLFWLVCFTVRLGNRSRRELEKQRAWKPTSVCRANKRVTGASGALVAQNHSTCATATARLMGRTSACSRSLRRLRLRLRLRQRLRSGLRTRRLTVQRQDASDRTPSQCQNHRRLRARRRPLGRFLRTWHRR